MVKRSAIFILMLWLLSCNGNRQTPTQESRQMNRDMVDVNRYLVQKDNERIQNYIERKGLVMEQTLSGLWYSITRNADGEVFTEGSSLTIEYKTTLLDGTLCYTSDKTGVKNVVIDKSEIESGLNEGLKLLSPGDEALFILPPYLAFGLLGDGNLIPARSIIVIEVKVLSENKILQEF
jgi:FKBP-type peptidyl-prolyl cis-trans isomerase FkpA